MVPSQIWFIKSNHYHYAASITYITFYIIVLLLVSFVFQWNIKRALSSAQSSKDHAINIGLSVHLQQQNSNHDNVVPAIPTKHTLSTIDVNALEAAVCSSPSSARQLFSYEETLKKQSMANAWCSSLMHMLNIYRDILIELGCKALQIGVICKLLIIVDTTQHEDASLIRILLYISAFIYMIYKAIACITIYIISHRCTDVVLEVFNLTFVRCLYVNYRLHTQETCAPQKFFHLLHSSLKTSSLLLVFSVLLLRTNDAQLRCDPFILSCVAVSFISLLSSIISNDTNIMKAKWNCVTLNLLWRFSEITHRILLFLLLSRSSLFIIIISIEYLLCLLLFCYNHSVLVLGSIFFYHVTAGKYFGGNPGTQTIGYYIFVTFSIYRFLSSFVYLLVLTIITGTNIAIIYAWITLILWILCMFYVTEKGTRPVYNDQLLAPLAIYQQFVQLLDFIVFGASITDLVQRRYGHDNKNIIQYLCNKVTIHSQERLDIIRNILFGQQHEELELVECIHYAVTANQLNIVKFFTEACNIDVNVVNDNGQTALRIAIERSYVQIVQYLLTCPQLDISVKDVMNRTYLHFAAMSQSMQIVQCFDATQERISYDETDDYGKTMLFYVEEQALIEYLICEHKLDVNATDLDGKTVLFYSINENKFELSKYWIEQCSVDMNIRDKNGTLAFFYAQSIAMADYMIHTCEMDCNVVDSHDDSVICNAIAKHYSNELCKYYIETCHVNTAQIDKYKRTLVDIAVEHLNIASVKYLVGHNIGHNIPSIHIKTWCCAKDKLIGSLYELFLTIGGYSIDNIADVVNAKGNVHNIHYVIQSMRYVRDDKLHQFGMNMLHDMLLNNNQLVNYADDDQNTPIFYCIDTEIYELVELFVENGADLYHTNTFREAPLEYAIKKCQSNEIREYLMETKYNSPFNHTEKQQPFVLLQKTIEYLDERKQGMDDEDQKDIEEILDDIDMDHVIGMLDTDSINETVIVDTTDEKNETSNDAAMIEEDTSCIDDNGEKDKPLNDVTAIDTDDNRDKKETLDDVAMIDTDEKVEHAHEKSVDDKEESLDDLIVATMSDLLDDMDEDTEQVYDV